MAASTAESTPKDEPSSSKAQTDQKKTGKRTWTRYIVAPYLIGLVWHAIHPAASVFTGDFSAARRWYIDENSLEPSYFRMNAKYDILEHKQSGPSSMCQALAESINVGKSVSCHRLSQAIDIAEILPTSSAVAPTSEAIVLVVPSTENWNGGQFHFSVLQLIQRLSSPATAPWLSKTILIVTPVKRSAHTFTLQETVDTFLDNYLGSRKQKATNTTTINTLAKSAMIRNLLVLDVSLQTTGAPAAHELQILPQGKRGVLPNMDLLWVTMFCYSRATFLNPVRNPQTEVTMSMHPYYQSVAKNWLNFLKKKSQLPPQLHSWAKGFLDLILFEYTLLSVGPKSLAHAEALDRGIDALTIQGHFSGPRQQASEAELVQKMEYILRALSNLQERLHHSTSLYLLTSSERFVKHEEYLVPNLLLVIPCVIRFITLVLFDISRLDLSAIGWALSIATAGTALVAFGIPIVEWMDHESEGFFTDRTNTCNMVVLAVYLALFSVTVSWKAESRSRQSIQFAACLMAVYIHVPIALGHVSLAFPSALLWTPLIAFPSFREKDVGTVKKIASLAILVGLCPAYLIPNILPSYTPYVKYAYLPLHFMTSVLWNC